MIDPTSIGTALTTLAVIAGLVVAFGLAIVSDMALRRREDRAERPKGEPDTSRTPAVRAPADRDRGAVNGHVRT